MVDVPGNIQTTFGVAVGSSLLNTIDTLGDHDWFRIQLTAGQTISIAMDSAGATPLDDPHVRLRDAAGNLLAQNDDSGGTRNSYLLFTATTSGTFYIDAGAWDDSVIGQYRLTVSAAAPPAPLTVWSLDEVAYQLTNSYWGGSSRAFNVGPGGAITVNLTGLTSEGQFFARTALSLWTDVIGVRFTEVGTGGQMTFDDGEEGAFSSSTTSAGRIISSKINVSTDWITRYGTTSLNSYSLQTYVHEIGHALGLGHAGSYNSEASYLSDAKYLNDSWSTSIMSYFDQRENTWFADQGFTRSYVLSPMLADVVAMSKLYGLSTTTRVGDSTYGFNSTAGQAIFDARQYASAAYTIVDSSGTDTLDYSGYATNQLINLEQGSYSNVGSKVGNIAIAIGTVIENAAGGSGNDRLLGNAANNLLVGNGGNDTLSGGAGNDVLTGGAGADSLTGGAGADLFRDTAAGLSGDTLTDFGPGDRLLFTDVSLSGFSFSLTGTTLSYTGGSLFFGTVLSGTFTAGAAASGGVELTLVLANRPVEAANDFNGDGISDVLWRNDNGTVTNWLGTAAGGFTTNFGNANLPLGSEWQAAGIGDFNNDGRADVLWRASNGTITNWLGQPGGGFVGNFQNANLALTNDWQVAGVGDFNGDGRSDVLWRHANGTVTDWLGQTSGGFVGNFANTNQAMTADWRVAGIGDFSGDGIDDILWRHTDGMITNWLGNGAGGFASNFASANLALTTEWKVAGVGDFNGDGYDDILWQHTNGTVTDWLGSPGGGFVGNFTNSHRGVDGAWRVTDIGDYNGDGRDDILWRHVDGTVTDWLGQGDGGFASNPASQLQTNDWHVSPNNYLV